MNKKYLSLSLLLPLIASCDVPFFKESEIESTKESEEESISIKESESIEESESEEEYVKQDMYYSVRFLCNVDGVNVNLMSNYEAVGSNILFKKETVKENNKVSIPESVPTKQDYDFDCWSTNQYERIEYDFDTVLTSNLNLYAFYKRKESSIDESFKEVIPEFKEIIDNEIANIEITGVMNQFVEDNSVSLTTVGIKKLDASKENVKELLNYRINENYYVDSATYEDNEIEVQVKGIISDDVIIKTISINNITSTLLVDNTYYEQKAVNYENKTTIVDKGVVMAGSSSMENWTTSVEDMAGLTTINVGIGGTTIEQWNNQLATRLIYQYNPRAVILYVGINNVINSKQDGDTVGNNLVSLFDNIHAHLPESDIYYILMNLVPGYMDYQSVIERGNEIALNYGNGKDYMNYIDAGHGLIKESGKPNNAFFLTDGLHMSLVGYTIWGKAVKDAIIEKETLKNKKD